MVSLTGSRRLVLIAALLIFALPCYVVFAVCLPLAAAGVGMVCELLFDLLTQRSSDSYEALQGFVPFSVASLAALIGLPAMVMFAKPAIQIFRGTAAPAPARARLTRTLKWALVPLVLMTSLMVRYGSWWWAANIETDLGAALNAAFELYLTGLPMLIPALCLHRFIARASV